MINLAFSVRLFNQVDPLSLQMTPVMCNAYPQKIIIGRLGGNISFEQSLLYRTNNLNLQVVKSVLWKLVKTSPYLELRQLST